MVSISAFQADCEGSNPLSCSRLDYECFWGSWSGQAGSSLWTHITYQPLYVELEKWLNSPPFHGGIHGFESRTRYHCSVCTNGANTSFKAPASVVTCHNHTRETSRKLPPYIVATITIYREERKRNYGVQPNWHRRMSQEHNFVGSIPSTPTICSKKFCSITLSGANSNKDTPHRWSPCGGWRHLEFSRFVIAYHENSTKVLWGIYPPLDTKNLQ